MSINLSQENKNYDIIVVGGGPAGYVSAITAAQLGAKVALIEKNKLGGTCLNKGCIPSKSYLKTAKMIEDLPLLQKRGIQLTNDQYTIDMQQVVAEKDRVVETLRKGVATLLESHQVDVYQGEAKIKEDKTVWVGEAALKAEKAILAAGSKPKTLDLPGADSSRILTSEEIFDLEAIPKELVIIGAGAIGLEMATVFNAFGSKVTLVSHSPQILKNFDKDIAKEVEKITLQKGIQIVKNAKLLFFEEKGDKVEVHLQEESIQGDYVLLAVGQEPALGAVQDLHLQMTKGKLDLNQDLSTSKPWLYAPGDVNKINMSAHAATMMGQLAAENAVLGTSKAFDARFIPSCIYTTPEVAAIGLTESEAQNLQNVLVGKFPLSFNGRALAYGESKGFIKIIAGKKYGELLGAHIVGEKATELINEIAIIMQNELTIFEVINTIHAHPTYSEIIVEACADTIGRSIHLPKKTF